MWNLFFILLAANMAAIDPSSIEAVTLEGQTISGKWEGLAADGMVSLLVEQKVTTIPIDQLMLIHRTHLPSSAPASDSRPSSPGSLMIHLHDGSRFPATLRGGSARQIEIETLPTGPLTVPLTAIAAVRRMDAAPPNNNDIFDEALRRCDATQDELFIIRDGRATNVRGLTESIAPEAITFKYREQSRTVPWSDLYGLILAKGVQAGEPPQARCLLDDDSILAGRLLGGDRQSIEMQLSIGATIAIPLAALREIRFHSERVVFLSDLTPSDYTFEPFGITHWPYRLDRSVANRPLRIGGKQYARGIGMHSVSTLTYKLDTAYKTLAADIGIDAAVGQRGDVVFRVLADGQEVFNSGPVTGRDPPRSILVKLEGARQLQLCVDLGGQLDIGDQANWGNIRLIK